MKKRFFTKWKTFTSLIVLLLALLMSAGVFKTLAAPPSLTPLRGHLPEPVAKGQARVMGQHNASDTLYLAVGLQLRDKQGLARFLRMVSDPKSPQYGKYLTPAQANQRFNPTPQQEQQVVNWLRASGLIVTRTYANHLLVDAKGSTRLVEQMLHLTINDYVLTSHGKQITFYAPSQEPLVESTIAPLIAGIAGLDDYTQYHLDTPFIAQTGGPNRHRPSTANNVPPYYPQDFANAYNVTPLWNAGNTGVNQYIGITLWTIPPSDNTLQFFNTVTGSTVPLQVNKRLSVIQVDGGTIATSTLLSEEAALDIEYTGGMAPDASIDYYEMQTQVVNGTIQPTTQAMEDAINWAGTSRDSQISSSWGYCEPSTPDSQTQTIDNYLMSNTATGHTYFFSSGDSGSTCSVDGSTRPSYPASSDYATGVGGTTLTLTSGKYHSETAWSGSGGGFSTPFPRPWWQVAKGLPNIPNRGIPDVATDADPNTGGYLCYGNSTTTCSTAGSPSTYASGTSLASPLWAGMTADLNQYLQVNAQSVAGFINPTLYWLSNTPQYSSAYQDITSGSNGAYSAGPGWDPVTGLGTPNLNNIACDIARLCAWSIVPSLNEGSSSNYLNGVTALSTNNAWAVGYYTSPQYQQTQIQHWNGTQWSVVASPNGMYNNALYAVSGDATNDVWAVGYSANNQALIEQWNGTQWNIVPNPAGEGSSNYATLYGVAAISPSDVWAVGSYYNSTTNTYQTLTENWNGTQWNIVPSPNPLPNATSNYNQLTSVKAISPTDIWAVGYYYTGPGNSTSFQTLTEHWNGSQWSIVSSPNGGGSNGVLNSVTANSTSDVWAVGTYYQNPLSSNPLPQTLIEHWNGTQWSIISSPNVRLMPNYLNGVAAISSSQVWAVGYSYNSSTGLYSTLTESWNGKQWSLVPSPNYQNGSQYQNVLNAVAGASSGKVWAVGEVYYYYCCGYQTLIEAH